MWDVVCDDYMNANLIFPTQQHDVYHIIKICRQDPNIKKVVIFGSNATSACNPWSDIDIYLEMDKEKLMPVFGLKEVATDMWNNFTVDDDLYREIKEKGVVVYERESRC